MTPPKNNSLVQQDKSVRDIFDEQLTKSLKEHNRSNSGVFISSLSAGLEVGFSVYCIALVIHLFKGHVDPNTLHILKSLAYTIGFIFVTVSRSELFTEQTALSVLPVMNKKTSIKSLVKLWGAIFAGNIVGCLIFSILILQLNANLWSIDTKIFSELALGIIAFPWQTIIISSVIAGWLMALLSWMVTSCNDSISRIIMVILVTFMIAFGNLHHCILGATEVLLGLFTTEKINLIDYLRFQFLATFGNALGGIIFVAALKHSFIHFSDLKISHIK